MSAYDHWLGEPYQLAADEAEADREAREKGYEDAEDMLEQLEEEAAEQKRERELDR